MARSVFRFFTEKSVDFGRFFKANRNRKTREKKTKRSVAFDRCFCEGSRKEDQTACGLENKKKYDRKQRILVFAQPCVRYYMERRKAQSKRERDVRTAVGYQVPYSLYNY